MHFLGAPGSPGATERTEATHVTNEKSVSIPSAPTTPAKDTATKTENDIVEVPGNVQRILPIEDVQSPPQRQDTCFKMRWTEPDGSIHLVAISKEVIQRLKASYAYSEDSFFSYFRNYVKRKYVTCEMSRFPFILPLMFYLLCQVVMGVTHELFSDPLSQSGVLPHYCSEDDEDVVFGSKGVLCDIEENVNAGAGILPYGEEFLTTVYFKKLEKKMRSGIQYCRVFVIPIEKGSKLLSLFHDEEFLGELVCLTPPDHIRFLRHNIDVFRHGCDSDPDDSWKPPWKLAIVIWMNEAYRIAHPPPDDVEECFTFWAVDIFEDHTVVDFDGLYRCFPPRTRRLIYNEQILQGYGHTAK